MTASRRAKVAGILLTPGAGASSDHHSLIAVEHATTVPVRRIDFPYRIAGRRMPDRVNVATAHVRAEAERFAAELDVDTSMLVLGGRSYGGRMCSLAVADGLPAAGLALLSYPLHPPGKSAELRTAHFPALNLPILFVSGEKDPFGTPAEFDAALDTIPGNVTRVLVPGGHDVRGQDEVVATAVTTWIEGLS